MPKYSSVTRSWIKEVDSVQAHSQWFGIVFAGNSKNLLTVASAAEEVPDRALPTIIKRMHTSESHSSSIIEIHNGRCPVTVFQAAGGEILCAQ